MSGLGIQLKSKNDSQITEIDNDTIRICGASGEVVDLSIPWLGGDMND